MKRIDFREFRMFTDISQESTVTVDARRDVADSIYKNTNGIAAHDLALRIYRSTGPVELTDEEAAILTDFARRGTPIFADSMEANITDSTETEGDAE